MIMKGQFFIIATVVIIAALIMLMQYFYDFGKTDLTTLEELSEPDYIAMIKQSFLEGIDNSLATGDCDKLAADLDGMEQSFRSMLISKGISFDASFNTTECPDVDVSFNLTTNKFHSETSFSRS